VKILGNSVYVYSMKKIAVPIFERERKANRRSY